MKTEIVGRVVDVKELHSDISPVTNPLFYDRLTRMFIIALASTNENKVAAFHTVMGGEVRS